MVIQNTYPNLSNIVHTDFELGRVIQTVTAADPGITVYVDTNDPKWGGSPKLKPKAGKSSS